MLPSPGAILGGRYRIDEMLGQGGMGAVFAATHTLSGRAVALKVLLPQQGPHASEAIQRFFVEAQACSRIEHPNVVATVDVGAEGGAPYLVMERLRGESLATRLKRGRLSVFDALDILIPACAGVAEAHREGVVHRDLKPDNIFLCIGKDGSARAPKVLDFGVSKLFEDPHGRSLTQTGVSLGTPEYMCPEQIDRPQQVDALFDVYSMGVVLYEALSGQRPYRADGLFQLAQQIAAGRPTPLHVIAPDVPADLQAVVARAMHVRREERFQGMNELISALTPIYERVKATAPMPMMTPAPHPQAMPYPPTAPPYTSHPQVSYAPPTTPYAPYPPAPPSYAMHPQPAAGSAGRGIIIALALLSIALVVAGVGVAGLYFFVIADEDGGMGGGGSAAASDDPLRPDVSLVTSGDCVTRFDGPVLAVTLSNERQLAVSSVENGQVEGTFILNPGQAATQGTIALSTEHFQQTQMMVGISALGNSPQFWNWKSGLDSRPGETITGTITFAAYDPARGVMDVVLDDVTLQEATGTRLCRVEGRVRTRGLTWGGAPPP
jgi:serine/threonine protein kinase